MIWRGNEMFFSNFSCRLNNYGYSRTHALFKVLIPSAFLALWWVASGPYTDYALAGQFLTSAHLYTMAIGMYYVSTGTVSMNYNVFAAFAVLMDIPEVPCIRILNW
ncbi:MAG: hypothetical protein LVQ96_07295 [Thermoplasmatales archaeon]|nr:hypothetical protein [Thermoplasmatales archaeon]